MNGNSLSLRALAIGALAIGAVGFGAVSGCSGDEKKKVACEIGETECLGDTLARVCAETGANKTPTWIPFECADGSRCMGGSGEGGADAATPAACVGTCTPGAAECVTAEVSRYCLDGRVWQLDACGIGEQCGGDGRCGIGAEGGVMACTPGARSCAASDVAKVCDTDGSSWIPLPCAGYETCDSVTGQCEPDPQASCDALGGGGICLDAQTAVRCSTRTGGFELDACPDTTYCRSGRCVGDVCAIGSSCVGLNQIRTCVDGVNQTDRQCESNEICVQDQDEARCVVPDCVPDDKVCGDPRDATVVPTTGYSVCRASGDTNSGMPTWQFTQCEGQLECSPTLVDSANPCRKECTPGEKMCVSDGAAGIHQGWVTCQDDGTWGTITNCNPDPSAELELVCANKPFQDAGALNDVACAEPVCAAVWGNLLDVSNVGGVPLQQGACEDEQIVECDPDTGRLAASAVSCSAGICLVDSIVPLGDGRLRGSCRDVAACEDGESICVLTGVGSTTPFFRTCQNGAFGTALERCQDDATCFSSVTIDGLRIASCGGECGQGWTRCGADGVETCGSDGTYGDGVACSVGHCENVGSNQAKCVFDCIPGSLGCGGTSAGASDGFHTGTTHAITCKDDGTWASAFDPADDAYVTACDIPGGEACRISSRGEGLGCVQCIGPNVLGGNDQGVSETRCDPTTPANLQECGADNSWETSTVCGSGKSCVGPSPVCSGCYSERGFFVSPCVESVLNDVAETCGACSTSVGVLGVCSQALLPPIPAPDGGAPTPRTCVGEGLGPATSWGGYVDCCTTAQSGTVATCDTQGYGPGGSWAGETDCCQSAQDFVGSGLAYCGG